MESQRYVTKHCALLPASQDEARHGGLGGAGTLLCKQRLLQGLTACQDSADLNVF